MLGALMGRKAVSMSTLGRATTAARGVGRSVKEAQDIARAKERLETARRELEALQQTIEAEVADLTAKTGSTNLETIEIRPKRGAVEVRLVTLAWKPKHG
jgi:Skp family chaperone for outer membrane proteins